jgi:hypothetical protein
MNDYFCISRDTCAVLFFGKALLRERKHSLIERYSQEKRKKELKRKKKQEEKRKKRLEKRKNKNNVYIDKDIEKEENDE